MTANEIAGNGKLIVDSRINDDFEGFDDEMLFALSNGQYWIQAEYKYWYHYSYMPPVKIYSYKGSYYIFVDGQIQTVKVLQIKDVTEATIINDFNGWSGETLFELDNGQIWKQAEYAYRYQYSYRPKAIIYPVSRGYKIQVEGEAIGVRRLK
ncbi:MAG: hypothetical protein QM768_12410 [Agriterribacter sp.]